MPSPAYLFTRHIVQSLAVEPFPHEDVTMVMAICDYYGIEPYESERERCKSLF